MQWLARFGWRRTAAASAQRVSFCDLDVGRSNTSERSDDTQRRYDGDRNPEWSAH
jgi:hypothetical protein